MKRIVAEKNSAWGAAPMVQPQGIEASKGVVANGNGEVRK